MIRTTEVVRGIAAPAWLAGTARGLLEAAALAAIVAAVAFLTGGEAPADLQVFAPLFIWIGRTLEGFADQIDPAKQRRT